MKKLVILGAIAAVASLALPSAPAEAKRRVCHVEKHCLNPHGFKCKKVTVCKWVKD